MTNTARDIYDAALSIMNEPATSEYETRSVGILNTLIGQCWRNSTQHIGNAHDGWIPIGALSDAVVGVDQTLQLSVMPYGLAGMLYLDEDPERANSWWQVYLEGLAACKRERPADFEPIADVYGGIEYEEFGRW